MNCSGAESYKEGVKAFAKMKGNLPDAILCISDEEAIGIMHSAMDAGIKVPEELQIISFNFAFEFSFLPTTFVLFNHYMISVVVDAEQILANHQQFDHRFI